MRRMLAWLLCTALVVAALAGCAGGSETAQPEPDSAQEAVAGDEASEEVPDGGGIFTPGTYTGQGEGHNGPIEVTVTVDADAIVSIEIGSHEETAGISDPAFERIPAGIIEYQTVAVDTVSGCTVSSAGIAEAVKDALLSAGASEADITKAPAAEQTEAGDAIEKTADIVIIGSGGAGMSAALEALEAGSTVIVVEKNPTVGGNTAVAGSAMNAADPDVQRTQTMGATEIEAINLLLDMEAHDEYMERWQNSVREDLAAYVEAGETYLYDSPDLHKLQTYIEGDYVGNPVLIEIFGDNALDSVQFLTSLGANWNDGLTAAVGATWTRSHTPTKDWGSAGSSFVLPQEKVVRENGGDICLEHRAEKILMDDNGRAVGVEGTTADGTPFVFTADKGVILATGGFGANVEMRQQYNKHWKDLGEDVETTNLPTATGDGIVMAEAAGANLIGMEWIQMLPTGKIAFSPTINNTIFVNNLGERFVKEDGRRDELSAAVLDQPGAYYYKIVDAHTAEDELAGITYQGLVIEDIVDGEYCLKGESIADLAEQLGMDPQVLQDSVDEFNGAVETGEDRFGRKVFDQKLDRGPYYALHGVTKVHHTMGGVEIDTLTRVIGADGEIIPGLYAAGEVTGGIHGSNRLGGNAIADVITFGRIAGQSAAAER